MIEIDDNHRELIAAFIRCQKPNKILELGFGTGKTTLAIMQAIASNNRGQLTVVDNFHDWCGKRPPHLVDKGFELVVSSEADYVNASPPESWDCIIADADHSGTDRVMWGLLQMLKPKGFIFVHDVRSTIFPNLQSIPRSLHGLTFDQSSQLGEECHRGLFIYQKP